MPEIGDIWVTTIPKIETKNNRITNKIERNQLVKKIGKLSKCDTYVYISELMSFMNNDIKSKFGDEA